MNNIKTSTVTKCAVIAAIYAALTYLSAAFSLAYGPIQFRISEALCVLPLFSPYPIAGLTLGCLISNIASFNPLDMIFGTLATLIAGILTYLLRNRKIFRLPLLSLLAPVITNSIIVGLEIAFFYLDGFSMYGFLISALEVGAGELIVVYGLGIPLYKGLTKHHSRLF